MSPEKTPVTISTTSWKARINTVGKTIYSVLRSCNPERVCLTLSSDEFPNKEKDLPANLLGFVEAKLLEIIWTEKNVRCFKKILFAMRKHPESPVVSADDDCWYLSNYAKALYEAWVADKECIYTYRPYTFMRGHVYVHGPAAIYPPDCFKEFGLKYLENERILKTWHDDVYYSVLAEKMGICVKGIPGNASTNGVYVFHDCKEPLGRTLTCSVKRAKETCEAEINV